MSSTEPKAVEVSCPVIDCDGLHFLNLPLLRKVVEYITQQPDEWHQEVWAARTGQSHWVQKRDEHGRFIQGKEYQDCGTAMCVAGHAAVMDGFTVQWHEHDEQASCVVETDEDGRAIPIETAATHALGLGAAEASGLFEGDNSLSDIIELCEGFAMHRAGEDF